VRNLVRAGVDPAVVMKISDHRIRNVFEPYNIIPDAGLSEGFTKTSLYVDGLPSDSAGKSIRKTGEGRAS
jgi:hypothetical protein